MNRIDISSCARVGPSLASLVASDAKFGEPITLSKTITVEQDTLGQVTVDGEKQANPAHIILNDLISKGGKIQSTKTTWTIVHTPRLEESEGFGVPVYIPSYQPSVPTARQYRVMTNEEVEKMKSGNTLQERAAQIEKEVENQKTLRAQTVKKLDIPTNTSNEEGEHGVEYTLGDLVKEYNARKELEMLKKTHGHNHSDATLENALDKINKLEKLIEKSDHTIESRDAIFTRLMNLLDRSEVNNPRKLSMSPEDMSRLE